MVRAETKSTHFLGGDKQNGNTKQKEPEMADHGCCGIPFLSWYPSEKKQPARGKSATWTTKYSDRSSNGRSLSDKNNTSIRSNIYKLFSCDTPSFCSCGTCMFCDSSYSNQKVLKGRKAPNTIYTEVVVSEPKPTGSCFGWYDQKEPPTREQISTKVSSIYKPKSLNSSEHQLENLARADSEEVVTQEPCKSRDSQLNDVENTDTCPRYRKGNPLIPWNTEFKSGRVIIEDRDCGELDEGDVLFGQSLSELAVEAETGESETCTADENQSSDELDFKPKRESEEYRICFVESEADATEDEEKLSAHASESDECEDDDVTDEMVDIPLTPYSLGKLSWNGRLEIMEEIERAK